MSPKEGERWLPTVCLMCYSGCGIKAQLVDGTLVDIRGDPDNPHSNGRICAKGKAGIMGLYDPYRVTAPLKRTNPKKGIGVDPGWETISWEQALDIVTERLKKVKAEDVRKFWQIGNEFQANLFKALFSAAFGSGNLLPGPSSYFCGPAVHMTMYLTQGAFYMEPDFHYCNYMMLVGNQEGFMINKHAVIAAQRMAEARARGMKVVVVDPVCNVAASKADEWVPIRPGTDGAFALGILNLLINELGIYDADFLVSFTNASYLVGTDGLYVRSQVSGHPLIWDHRDGQAKEYNAQGLKEPALEGHFEAQGQPCQTAFSKLKEHVKKYTPLEVSCITGIPAQTITRLAQEMGEAAHVGSKIVIEGVEFPYRPAMVVWTRGAGAHKHGGLTILALQLINLVLGAVDNPGGLLGNKTVTPFGRPREGPDGMIVAAASETIQMPVFPPRHPAKPEAPSLIELFPVSSAAGNPSFEEGVLHPERYGVSYQPEILFRISSNLMMSASNPGRMAEVFKKIPFIVSFTLYLDEFSELADLVLPDAHYLERLTPFVNVKGMGQASGPCPWYWPVQQPILSPRGEARPWIEVFLEIAERIGIREDLYVLLNTSLQLKEEYKLGPGKRYTWQEIVDRWSKSWFGQDRGLDWFHEHGVIVFDKDIKDAYPRSFIKGRAPVYFEHFLTAGKQLEKVTNSLGLPWDTSDFVPLPEWKPCPAHQESDSQYDLFAVNYKLTFHNFSNTPQNPWLNEIGEHHPYAYKLLVNASTAAEKGMRDGEWVFIESREGKVKGQVRVSECIHPEVVAIAGTFGHWAQGMPVAKGKGIHFNTLLLSGLGQVDTITSGLDACVKVKIYKAI